MDIVVACATCHRRERWRRDVREDVDVTVLIEGGVRRPPGHPEWSRGQIALAARRGEMGPVVGRCSACGQLLCAEDVDAPWPRMEVRVQLPGGTLRIGEALVGPDGEAMTDEDAEALLEQTFARPRLEGLVGDLGRSTFFLVLLGPFGLWLLALVFVVSFLLSIYNGVPDAVRGTPGYDRTGGVELPGGSR